MPSETLPELICPECQALAVDLDGFQAVCNCGNVWEIMPVAELWISVLLEEIARLRRLVPEQS